MYSRTLVLGIWPMCGSKDLDEGQDPPQEGELLTGRRCRRVTVPPDKSTAHCSPGQRPQLTSAFTIRRGVTGNVYTKSV